MYYYFPTTISRIEKQICLGMVACFLYASTVLAYAVPLLAPKNLNAKDLMLAILLVFHFYDVMYGWYALRVEIQDVTIQLRPKIFSPNANNTHLVSSLFLLHSWNLICVSLYLETTQSQNTIRSKIHGTNWNYYCCTVSQVWIMLLIHSMYFIYIYSKYI